MPKHLPNPGRGVILNQSSIIKLIIIVGLTPTTVGSNEYNTLVPISVQHKWNWDEREMGAHTGEGGGGVFRNRVPDRSANCVVPITFGARLCRMCSRWVNIPDNLMQTTLGNILDSSMRTVVSQTHLAPTSHHEKSKSNILAIMVQTERPEDPA
ncbi:hypothetical protein R3P38DRAFT_2798472 [Favolaschia claudopus]|uniref:Uncharacterized protein n=1 Tax=Favolaschia claudopus TaxID=2862362 RepID=A0AAW0A1V1_9AGAR